MFVDWVTTRLLTLRTTLVHVTSSLLLYGMFVRIQTDTRPFAFLDLVGLSDLRFCAETIDRGDGELCRLARERETTVGVKDRGGRGSGGY